MYPGTPAETRAEMLGVIKQLKSSVKREVDLPAIQIHAARQSDANELTILTFKGCDRRVTAY